MGSDARNSDLVNFGMALNIWGGIFPILELPCPPASKPKMEANFVGNIHFSWWQGDTNLYQVSLASFPDDHILYSSNTLTDNNFFVTDNFMDSLQLPEGRYNIRLRRVCNYMDSPYPQIIWSDWGEPRQFLYMHSTAGIDATDGQTPVLLLSPNPAKGTVTVEMDETQRDASLQTIQVVDMEGRVVLTQPWESTASQPLTLDISGLAAGVYLVRLNTPMGTTTRKLVVE